MHYIKLKEAISTAEQKNGLHHLDLVSREILREIASAELMYQKLRMSDLKLRQQFGTTPTILSRVQKLIDGGWVQRSEDKNDGRVILLQLTRKAKATFKRMSSTLERKRR